MILRCNAIKPRFKKVDGVDSIDNKFNIQYIWNTNNKKLLFNLKFRATNIEKCAVFLNNIIFKKFQTKC